MTIPDYKLIGGPRKQRDHGILRDGYHQRYRVLVEKKRQSVSLKTDDLSTARRRAVAYVEQALRDKQPKSADAKYAAWVDVPLDTQIDDYISVLENEGNSKQHYTTLGPRLKRIVGGCKFKTIGQINDAKIKDWLAKQRKTGKHAMQTSQHHWAGIKAFSKWLWKAERIAVDPLARCPNKLISGDIEPTFTRRPFSEVEFSLLLANAKAEKPDEQDGENRTYGLSGNDRIHIYLLAHASGFRASELASLTPAHFHLGKEPFVSLSATVSKRRRRDQQPISHSLAEIFRAYLSDRSKSERIWPGTWHERTTDVMSLDMKGIEKDTAEGRLTFHSTRHSFVTAAVNSVSNPQLVLEICRLSTPDLLKRYYHSKDEQRRAAVESLPSFGLPG